MARGRTSFKCRVVTLRQAEPDLSIEQIAERIGCAAHTVRLVCAETGLAFPSRRKVARYVERYTALRNANPHWSVPQLARELGITPQALYDYRRRHEPEVTVLRLGLAARDAGLTIQQIRAMADARHA